MDTPLRLEFKVNEEERRRYWRRDARQRAWIGRLNYLGGVAAFLGMGIVFAALDHPAWLVLLGAAALGVIVVSRIWPSTEERALRHFQRRRAYRFALRYIQPAEVDAQGIRGVNRGLFGRAKLTWNRVTEAERLPGFWYFRSGGAQFIVPVRAFPTAESLADFVRITEERIPASAWRDQ